MATSSSQSQSTPGRARRSGATDSAARGRRRRTRPTTRPRPRPRLMSAASSPSSPTSARWVTDGRVLWSHRMGPFQNFYGMSASPIIADGLVIQLIDQLRARTCSRSIARRARFDGGPIGRRPRSAARRRRFPPLPGPRRDHHDRYTRLDSYLLGTGMHRWWTPIGTPARWVSRSPRETRCSSRRRAATSRGCHSGCRRSCNTTRTRTAGSPGQSSSKTRSSANTSAGSHDDDGFVTEAEWSVARALGLGAWGSVAMTPGAAAGSWPARP